MSTRSVFEVKSDAGSMFIYKHWDGYPSGAQQVIRAAIDSGKVWPLPRFEPDEFAAGIIAAGKDGGGDFRLLGSRGAIPADVEYWHVLHVIKRELRLTSYPCDWDKQRNRVTRGKVACEFATYGTVQQ
jgi:hypothetical protein